MSRDRVKIVCWEGCLVENSQAGAPGGAAAGNAAAGKTAAGKAGAGGQLARNAASKAGTSQAASGHPAAPARPARPAHSAAPAHANAATRDSRPVHPAAESAADKAADKAAARAEAVAAAFVLGWRLAELYDRDALPPPVTATPAAAATPAAVPLHLPGASEMTEHTRAVVLLKQASAALAELEASLGSPLPGLAKVGVILDQPGHDRDDVRAEIMTAYLEIRGVLLGADPPAATSYGLGRLLADTTYLPRSGHPDIFIERFSPYRVTCACGWLADLAAAFPHRAAAAVRVSFRAWADWVSQVSDQQSSPGGRPGTASPEAFGENVLRALHAQGEMWRRLLSGEQDPMQLLGPGDYVEAGERLLQRARQISGRFLVKWWPGIVVLLAASGAAIWAALTFAPSGASKLAAVLVSGAATLGLTWKGISATLGKALSQTEAALWAAEVDAATGMAATILPAPTGRRITARRPGRAPARARARQHAGLP